MQLIGHARKARFAWSTPETLPDSAPALLEPTSLTTVFHGFGALDLKGVGITYSGFVDQILKASAVRDCLLDVGDQFIGNVDAKPFAFASAIKSIAGMAFSALTDRAICANARTPAQRQRACRDRP